MKNRILLFLCAVLLMLAPAKLNGQSIRERYQEIENLRNDGNGIIPSYLFDSIATTYQDGMAGTQVKQGKYVGTSLSLDDKSATANIGIKSFSIGNSDVYSALQISGDSKDNFITLLEKGKYQQTITFGGVLNIFVRGFAGTSYCSDKYITHQRVEKIHTEYAAQGVAWHIAEQRAFIQQSIHDLEEYVRACCHLGRKDKCAQIQERITSLRGEVDYPDIVDKGEAAKDTLMKLGIIGKNFDETDCNLAWDAGAAAEFYLNADSLRMAEYVHRCEQVYMDAPWTSFRLFWITLNGSYNISPEPILDTTLVKDNYLRTYNNEYAKFSLALNYMHVNNWGKNLQINISPTFSISTPRNFNSDDEITITKYTPYARTPNDTVLMQTFTSQGYEKVAGRAYPWNIELPITLLWNSSNYGIDFSIHAGANDPHGDNVGGRLGFYIPIDIKDGVPVWIEPLARVSRLFNSGDMNFWKDNLTVGFNLSIALKKYSIGK